MHWLKVNNEQPKGMSATENEITTVIEAAEFYTSAALGHAVGFISMTEGLGFSS